MTNWEPLVGAARPTGMGSITDTTTTDFRRNGRRPRSRPRLHRIGAVLAVAAIGLTACGGDDSDGAADDGGGDSEESSAADAGYVDPMTGSTAAMSDEMLASGDADAADGAAPAAADSRTSGDIDLGAIGRDVIIEMQVVVSSDDIARTVSSITATVAAVGGGVASSNVNYGDENAEVEEGFAVLVVKVPPAGVDRVISGLDDSGNVESISQSAQDVTEQLVDLEVRIANARQSVANVREFMDRAEDLGDLVTLESELTRRQTDLERLEAQQRNLTDRVALSTITIEIVPTDSVPADDDPSTIGDAFRTGWDIFFGILFALALLLAVLSPFLIIGAVVAVVVWLLVRRVSRARSTHSGQRTDPPPGHNADQNDELTSMSASEHD